MIAFILDKFEREKKKDLALKLDKVIYFKEIGSMAIRLKDMNLHNMVCISEDFVLIKKMEGVPLLGLMDSIMKGSG